MSIRAYSLGDYEESIIGRWSDTILDWGTWRDLGLWNAFPRPDFTLFMVLYKPIVYTPMVVKAQSGQFLSFPDFTFLILPWTFNYHLNSVPMSILSPHWVVVGGSFKFYKVFLSACLGSP